MIGGGPTSGAPQLRIKSFVISHTGKTYKGIAVLNQRSFILRISGTQQSAIFHHYSEKITQSSNCSIPW